MRMKRVNRNQMLHRATGAKDTSCTYNNTHSTRTTDTIDKGDFLVKMFIHDTMMTPLQEAKGQRH